MPKKIDFNMSSSLSSDNDPILTDEPKKITTRTKREKKPKIKVNDENNETKEKKLNPWLQHCKTVKEANPNVSYNTILKMAKDTYTKK